MMKYMLASQTREMRLSEKVSESVESVRRERSSAIPFLSLLIKSAAFARRFGLSAVSIEIHKLKPPSACYRPPPSTPSFKNQRTAGRAA